MVFEVGMIVEMVKDEVVRTGQIVTLLEGDVVVVEWLGGSELGKLCQTREMVSEKVLKGYTAG